MGRTARDRRPPTPKPVERVQMDERHFSRRMIAFLLCLAVAVAALGYGVYSWLNTEPGWVTIEARGGCGPEFTFRYLFTQGGMEDTDRHRTLRNLFDRLTIQAYRQFSPAEVLEEGTNLQYINAHPNQDVQVEPVLYQAFEQAQAYEDRSVYLGPLYGLYTDLAYSQDDGEARGYDPYESPEQAAFCQTVADFARDPAAVNVKLLGDNTLRLEVSPAYLSYAQDQGVETFLDFGWQRNAYIIDYFAMELASQGFTSGVLTSTDGFSRSLFAGAEPSLYSLYTWHEEGRTVVAGQVQLDQIGGAADFRAFPMPGQEGRCYVREDGQIRHPYVDLEDGLCRAAVPALVLYAPDKTCVQLMEQGRRLFIAQNLDRTALAALTGEGIYALAVENGTLLHSDPAAEVQELYSGYEAQALPYSKRT